MASNGTIAHRFANRDYNMERGLQGNSTHISGRNYYSYSTVFGQWVDLQKKVCLVFNGETSVTSHKHMLGSYCFPDDVVILPYDDGGGYYGWHGCNLISSVYGAKDTDWSMEDRLELLTYYIKEMYYKFENITTSKKAGAESIRFDEWEYVEKLCSLYKDTSVQKWLKQYKNIDKKFQARMRKLAKMLLDGERDVATITNALFGDGAFEKYMKYCERFRKANDKKWQMEWLCHRLGMESPYGWDNTRGLAGNPFKVADIRKMAAKERVQLHFDNLMQIEWNNGEKARNEKYEKNKSNAYKWITGYERKLDRWSSSNDMKKCRNMFTGKEYNLPQEYIYGLYWCKKSVGFNYNNFRHAEDKQAWIEAFYAECEEVERNTIAITLLKGIKANTKEKEHLYDDDMYIFDAKIENANFDAESLAIIKEFIAKQDKHFADEAARKRAERIRREREEAERKAEKERLEAVKQEQIDEHIKQGAEGCRNLWRDILMDIWDAEYKFDHVTIESGVNFYYGGNVLLRLNLNKTKVQSSKGVSMPIEWAKKLFPLVKRWHENPASFRETTLDTHGDGKYTISSYRDDIMTAGCHKIAYVEMERMYNQIVNL